MNKSGAIVSIDKIRLVSMIILVGFVVAVLFHGLFLKRGYPWDTFLFDPHDRFMDFYGSYDVARHLDPYFSHGIANYFPLAYLILYPLTRANDPLLMLVSYLMFVCGFIFCYAEYFLRHIKAEMGRYAYFQSLVIILFLSYPTLILLDRANLDGLLFVF